MNLHECRAYYQVHRQENNVAWRIEGLANKEDKKQLWKIYLSDELFNM